MATYDKYLAGGSEVAGQGMPPPDDPYCWYDADLPPYNGYPAGWGTGATFTRSATYADMPRRIYPIHRMHNDTKETLRAYLPRTLETRGRYTSDERAHYVGKPGIGGGVGSLGWPCQCPHCQAACP